jgi:hypothetical protein
MAAQLVSSQKIGGFWIDVAPGIGTLYNDCYDAVVQHQEYFEDPPGVCHTYVCEETQRRCFDGRFTLQKYVEIFLDIFEETKQADVLARVGAYGAGGGIVLVTVGTLAASNPIGWVIIAGTVLGVGGTVLWVESDRFVYQYSEKREEDSGMTRTGFSGVYSVEITDARVLGNPSAPVECEAIPREIRETRAPTRPVEGCINTVGRKGSQSDYICSTEFARGN